MAIYSIVAQVIVAMSIEYISIRIDNIVKEFKQRGLIDLTRSIIGSSEIALLTLLIAGIWHPAFGAGTGSIFGFSDSIKTFFSLRKAMIKKKHITYLLLLILSLFIAAVLLKLL